MRLPRESDFTSRLRGPAVATRVGRWLGICFGIAFLTGLISHWAQNPAPWVPFPTAPSWGYRVSQGLHVASGTAAVPLFLVKLWTVYPLLFRRVPKEPRERLLHGLERVSILVLVAAALFLLGTGLANTAQWYPWNFTFRRTHGAVAWIAIGALVLHIAIKFPVIRGVLRSDVDDPQHDREHFGDKSLISRRSLLRSTWAAAGLAVLATAGSTVPLLRKVSVFAVRTGEGPQGVPINKSARAADVVEVAESADYRLEVAFGANQVTFTRGELAAMPQVTQRLPIACVEGWSAQADWTGVRLRDLLAHAGAPTGTSVTVESMQPRGPYRRTLLPAAFADHEQTLMALKINGEDLSLDHGYPVRLIAPNRPGVLQTKWVARLESMDRETA